MGTEMILNKDDSCNMCFLLYLHPQKIDSYCWYDIIIIGFCLVENRFSL